MMKNKVFILFLLIPFLLAALLIQLFYFYEKNGKNDFNKSYFKNSESNKNMKNYKEAELAKEYLKNIEKIKREKNKVVNLVLIAEEKEVEIIPGKKTKLWVYNNQFPGPLIRVKEGDIINVTIINKLPEPTTVHWHGMRVPNQMDGVPNITQKPILPGEIFNYQFKVLDGGIYLYHPHYNNPEQIERGLYGAIIVDYKNENFYYDKDIVLFLDDILLDRNYQVYNVFDSPHFRMMGRFGNVLLVNGRTKLNYTFKEGDIVRLRFLNIANARIFYIKIKNKEEEKKMLVIGEDIGLVEKPYEIHELEISPGQRYDVLVYFNKSGTYYLIYDDGRREYILAEFKIRENDYNKEEKDSYYKKNKEQYNKNPEFEELLNNIKNAEIIKIDLFPEGRMMNMLWTINGKYYPNDMLYIEVEEGKYYILEFNNFNRIPHPMHLHGQRMLPLDGLNRFKDTVTIEPFGKLRVIFKAEGKGLWLFHCHILEHAEAGMTSVVKVI